MVKTFLLPSWYYNIPCVFPFETLTCRLLWTNTHQALVTFLPFSWPLSLSRLHSFLAYTEQVFLVFLTPILLFLSLHIPSLLPHSHNMDHYCKYLWNLIPISMTNYCFLRPVDIPACTCPNHTCLLPGVPAIIGFITVSTCSSGTLNSPFSLHFVISP